MKHNKIYLRHKELTEKIFNSKDMLPSRYVLVLTNLCNLNCSFCYQEKKYNPNSMSTKDWINLIKQFPDYSRVTLTGGEPFLYKGFKEVFHKSASKYECNIISNGTLLTKELIDFLLSYKNFKTLSISVDTIGNTNRNIKSSDWKKVTKMLHYFIKQRDKINKECKLDIKTTVLDENIEDLYDIHRYCIEELRADFHSFQLLKGSALQHSDKLYSYNDIFSDHSAYVYKKFDILKEQFNLIREYNMQNKISSFVHPKVVDLMDYDDTNFDFINNKKHDPNLYELCKFPWSSVHINYDGNLIPCLSIPMGNVKHHSLKDILNSPNAIRFKEDLKKYKTFNACNRCGWLKVNRCGHN
jgi:radical SAM protein with 4Fe4S-binding SPASM domain